MSTEQFMAAVLAEVEAWHEANFPTLDLVSENGPEPDEDRITTPWIDVSFRWFSAKSMTIGEVVKERHTGAVAVMVYARCGTGPMAAARIVDSVQRALAKRRVGGALLLSGSRASPTEHLGWYKTGVMFPFMLDV